MFGKKKQEQSKRVTFDTPEDAEESFDDDIEEEFKDADQEEEHQLKPIHRRESRQLPKLPPRPMRREVKETVKDVWVVKEVPVQVEKVLYNQETGNALDLYSAIAVLLNKVEE